MCKLTNLRRFRNVSSRFPNLTHSTKKTQNCISAKIQNPGGINYMDKVMPNFVTYP